MRWLSFLVFVSLPTHGSAECFVPDLCEGADKTRVIFLGETLAVNREPGEEIWQRARLKILERFRGVPADQDEIEILLFFPEGHGEGSPYEVGKRTLVFVDPGQDGSLEEFVCTQSVLVEEDSESLRYIREYFAGETVTNVRGRITVDYASQATVANARVLLLGAKRRYVAVSDEAGAYRIDGLAPGEYKVRLDKGGWTHAGAAPDVAIGPGGCALADFRIRSTNSIRGAVFDEDEEPAEGVKVFLEPTARRGGSTVESETDELGQYRFTQVEPGEYVAVVSPHGETADSPYRRSYFGGNAELHSATPITIEADSQLIGLDLYVGRRIPTREITVEVFWPDRVRADVSISCVDLSDEERSHVAKQISIGVEQCRVLADRPYRVSVDAASIPIRDDDGRPDAPTSARHQILRILPITDLEAVVPPGTHPVSLQLTINAGAYEGARGLTKRSRGGDEESPRSLGTSRPDRICAVASTMARDTTGTACQQRREESPGTPRGPGHCESTSWERTRRPSLLRGR